LFEFFQVFKEAFLTFSTPLKDIFYELNFNLINVLNNLIQKRVISVAKLEIRAFLVLYMVENNSN
jgi:hypothetical protein